MSLDLRPRSDWRPRPAESAQLLHRGASGVTGFMAHYSTGQELGRPDSAEWLRQIQAFHMGSRGWADIGYNFAIDTAGVAWTLRGMTRQGAHCLGYNSRALGVVFLGNDDPGVRDVTPAARLAFSQLYAEASLYYRARLEPLGHRDKFPTACPGDELYTFAHNGFPSSAAVVSTPTPSRPAPAGGVSPARPATVPKFPLPTGHAFGPKAGPAWQHSGYYSAADKAGVKKWQRRMAARGWPIDVDGLYGPQSEGMARLFQRQVSLSVDGLVGIATWRASWLAPIT